MSQGGLSRPRVFSGVQPSGSLTLGNYLGAIQRFVQLQDDHDCVYCVVDLHALTVPQDPAALRQQTLEVARLFMAAGIDPARAILFVQSHVPEHAELSWLLECIAGFGELGRMTQFKDKGGGQESVGVGLFTYPVLMAADILLYQTHAVPVGEDQKQHLELARDLAQRFNHRFGPTFRVPEPLIGTVGARVMSLQDPAKKMSKSDPNSQSYIALLDPPDLINQKIKRAVTDSGAEVRYDPDAKPAVSNLIEIYALTAGLSIGAVEERFAGQGYGKFKASLAEVVVERLRPIQERYRDLQESDFIRNALADGAERARAVAVATMAQVRDRVGLLPR